MRGCRITAKSRRITLTILIMLFVFMSALLCSIGSGGAKAVAEGLFEDAYPVTIQAEGGEETGYPDFAAAFRAADELSTTDNKAVAVKLYAATMITELLEVSAGADITLDLNGYAFRRRNQRVKTDTFNIPLPVKHEGDPGQLFEIDGSLTLNDSRPDRIHTNADRTAIGVPLYTKLPSGGAIVGGYRIRTDEDVNDPLPSSILDQAYGFIEINGGGALTMNGGTFAGNSGEGNGGDMNPTVLIAVKGTYIKDGEIVRVPATFTMNGGEITGNYFHNIVTGHNLTADFKPGASFFMNGGRITGNGIYCWDKTTVGYMTITRDYMYSDEWTAVDAVRVKTVLSGDAYIYGNYYSASKYQWGDYEAADYPDYAQPYPRESDESLPAPRKALEIYSSSGGYASRQPGEAKRAAMQPDISTRFYAESEQAEAFEPTFYIRGEFTGTVGLYDYRQLAERENGKYEAPKYVLYELLDGGKMNGTVRLVDAHHEQSGDSWETRYDLPADYTYDKTRYEGWLDGSRYVLYRKAKLEVTPDKRAYYSEQPDDFPALSAVMTDEYTGEAVAGTIVWDDTAYRVGTHVYSYTFTPTMYRSEKLYGVRKGTIELTCRDVRELKVTYNGGALSAGVYLADAEDNFTVSLVYTDGHTVVLDKGKYALKFGELEEDGLLRTHGPQFCVGNNTVLAEYTGEISGTEYIGSTVIAAESRPVEVWDNSNGTFTAYDDFDAAALAAVEPNQDRTIKLYRDVYPKTPITVPAYAKLTIDLNGHVLDLDQLQVTYDPIKNPGGAVRWYEPKQSPFLTVTDTGASLTVTDSNASAAHTDTKLPAGGVITGMRYNSVVHATANGFFRLTNGTIFGNGKADKYEHNGAPVEGFAIDGAAIKVTDGAQAVVGAYGTISANGTKGKWYGGGVYVNGGSLDVLGAIVNNTAERGGGVYFDAEGRIFTLKGSLDGNTASDSGGGAFVWAGVLKMYDGASVSANEGAVGVYAGNRQNDKVQFLIYGGTIANNTAGGLHIGHAKFKMYGGEITGNGMGVNKAGMGVKHYLSDAFLVGGTISGNGGVAGKEYNWDGGAVVLGDYSLGGDSPSNIVIGSLYMEPGRLLIVVGKFSGQIRVNTVVPAEGSGEKLQLTRCDEGGQVSETNIRAYRDGETVTIDGEVYLAAPRIYVYFDYTVSEFYPGADFPEITLVKAYDENRNPVSGTLYWLAPDANAPEKTTLYYAVFMPTDRDKYSSNTKSVWITPIAVEKITAAVGELPELFTSTSPESLLEYLSVTLTWASGKTETLTADRYTVSLPPSLQAGSNAFTVSASLYGKLYTATVTVNAAQVTATGIEVEFEQGGTAVYPTTPVASYPEVFGDGLKVWLNYNDGSRVRLHNYTLIAKTGTSGVQPGMLDVDIVYGDYKDTISLYVNSIKKDTIEAVFSEAGRSRVRTDFTLEQIKPYLTLYYVLSDGSRGGTVDTDQGIYNLFFVDGATNLAEGFNTLRVRFRDESGGVVGSAYETTVQIPAVSVARIEAELTEAVTIFDTATEEELNALLKNKVKATAYYNDGTSEDVSALIAFEGAPQADGTLTVRLGNMEVRGTFKAPLTIAAPVSISVACDYNRLPEIYTTMTPEQLKESIAKAVIVTALYSDGKSREISDYALRSGRTPAASGFRTHYFYYGESSALVSWQGLEARLSGLVFEDGSDVESVWVKLSDYTIYGYESLSKAMNMLWDNDCITVFVTYKDGMKINTAEKAEYKDGVRAEAKFTLVNGNELLSAGKDNAVDLSYMFRHCRFTLYSTPYVITDITPVDTAQTIVIYPYESLAAAVRKLGYTFDVTFNSGETQRRALSSLDYTVTGGDIAQPGTVTLSVSGSDLCAPVEVSFSVTAVAPASIAVTAPDGLTIAQGGDINALKKQLIVYVLNNDGSYYNNGSPIGDYALEGDVSEVGAATIVVRYVYGDETFSDTFDVNVVLPEGKLNVKGDFSGYQPKVGGKVQDALQYIEVYLALDNGTTRPLADGVTFWYGSAVIDENTLYTADVNTIYAKYTYDGKELSSSVYIALPTDVPFVIRDVGIGAGVYLHNSLDFVREHAVLYYVNNGETTVRKVYEGFAVRFKDAAQSRFSEGENTLVFSYYGAEKEFVLSVEEAAVFVQAGLEEACGYDTLAAAIGAANVLDAENIVTITLNRDFIAGKDGCVIDAGFVVAHNHNELVLDLNGHIIDRGLTSSSSGQDGRVFSVTKGSFTLADSNPSAAHAYDSKAYPAGGVIAGGFSYFSTDDGSATIKTGGGGINVNYTDDYVFTMNGGSVWGNKTTYYGAGIAVVSGTFILNGGAITGNSFYYAYDDKTQYVYGAGVALGEYVTFTMNGGRIADNLFSKKFTFENIVHKCSGTGAVYGAQGVKFTMTGGEIIDGNEDATSTVNIVSWTTTTPLPTEKELSKIYLYGGRIVKNSESGSAYALRAPEAMLYMAGSPVIDGGLYLTSYGESDYYAGCPYGYIVFTGDFTGTFELYRNNPLPYQALAGSSYSVDYFYQYVGYSASGVRVDTSGISCREDDPTGNKHFELIYADDGNNTHSENEGYRFKFNILDAALDVDVAAVYEGWTPADGLPAITLSDGSTPGAVAWGELVSSADGKYTYRYLLKPSYQISTESKGKVDGYKGLWGEYTIIPVPVSYLSVEKKGDCTVYESTDVTSTTFKNKFTVKLVFADGYEKVCGANYFDLAFGPDKTQLIFTYKSDLYGERGTYMLPVKIVPVKVETISAKVNFGEQAFVSTTEKELKEMLTVTAVNNDGTAYNGGEAIADFTVQFADGGLVTGRNVIFITVGGVTREIEIEGVLYGAVTVTDGDGTQYYYDDMDQAVAQVNALVKNTDKTVTMTLHADFVPGGQFSLKKALIFWVKSTRDKSLVLDLNGHILDRGLTKAATEGSVVILRAEETELVDPYVPMSRFAFTIRDGNPSAPHPEYGTAYPAGGVITGGDTTNVGGGIALINGRNSYYDYYLIDFTMTGGTIRNNRAARAGGGIGITTFTPRFGIDLGSIRIGENARIIGNSSAFGGGLGFMSDANDDMERYSPNVSASKDSVFRISGEWSENAADRQGGAIYWKGWKTYLVRDYSPAGDNEPGAELHLHNAKISGNIAREGGGIYLIGDAVFDNAEISGNTATVFGGGVMSAEKEGSYEVILENHIEIRDNFAGDKPSDFAVKLYVSKSNGSVTGIYGTCIYPRGAVTGKIGISAETEDFPKYINPLTVMVNAFGSDIGGLVIENRHEGAEFAKGTTSMTVSGEQKDNLATLALLVRGATPYLGSVVCKTPVYDSFTLPEIKWFGTVSKYQPSGTLAWDEGQTVTEGKKYYCWTFTPDDLTAYSPVHGAIEIGFYRTVSITPYSGKPLTGNASMTLDELGKKIREARLDYSDGRYDSLWYSQGEFTLEFLPGQSGWVTSTERDVVNQFYLVCGSFRTLYEVTIAKVELETLETVWNLDGATVFESDDIDSLREYLTVTARYAGSSSAVEITDYQLYGALSAGECTVEIRYGGQSKTVTVSVAAVEIESLSAMYAANALLDSNGSVAELRAYLSVVVTYTNGTTKTVSGYEIEETGLVAGEHEYTVTYGGKKTTFTANIKQGPREVEIVWATDDFTYDGTDRSGEITAYYLDADGNKVMLLVSGGELKNYSADGVVFTAAFAQETEGYLLPDARTKTYHIKKAALTITAAAHGIVYGQAPVGNGAIYSGFVNNEDESVLSGALVYTFTYEQYGNCGEYAIKLSGLTANNYAITFEDGDLTVSPAAVTVTIDGFREKEGAALKELTAHVTEGTVFNGDTLLYALSTSADIHVAGKYEIVGADNDDNYIITFVNGEYEIYSVAGFTAFIETYGELLEADAGGIGPERLDELIRMAEDYAALSSDDLAQFTTKQTDKIAALSERKEEIEQQQQEAIRQAYNDFVEKYDALLSADPAALVWENVTAVESLSAEYSALDEKIKALFSSAQTDAISSLTARAEKLGAIKAEADKAASELKRAVEAGAAVEELQSLLRTVKEKADSFAAIGGSVGEITGYTAAVEDAQQAIGQALAEREKEPLHVGWLVTDLILAVLMLAEIGYFVWRKVKGKKDKSDVKTYSVSLLSMALLASVHGGGWAAGVTFFVLLLISVLVLGIGVIDCILRDKGIDSPFAPIIDKVTGLAEKAFAYMKSFFKRGKRKHEIQETEEQKEQGTAEALHAGNDENSEYSDSEDKK